jgi:Phosphodiester glycosidase
MLASQQSPGSSPSTLRTKFSVERMTRVTSGQKPARRKVLLLSWLAAIGCSTAILALCGVWAYAGSYGLHVVFRHGGTYWVNVSAESARLSPSMRLALGTVPLATAGEFAWTGVAEGFEIADLPVLANGRAVDHVLLARINPARFRFEVRNASDGDMDLDQWMAHLGAALVVNGSYYALDGRPDTPFVSNGVLLGPRDYDAKAGAFVAGSDFTGIRDLAHLDWKAAFLGAQNAMVSYPLLVVDGATRVERPSRWLANRSFVGQDQDGWVVIGTTRDVFFSLDRFARVLRDAPLRLTLALNLDGGPVASQGISLNGFERRSVGRWEAEVEGDKVQLLTWPYGTVAMPIVLALFPR